MTTNNSTEQTANNVTELLQMFQLASIEQLQASADYLTAGQAIYMQDGVTKGNAQLYKDYIGFPLLDSNLNPVSVALLPPPEKRKDKPNHGIKYEPRTYPQGAYMFGTLTQHNRVYVVVDIEAGHVLANTFIDDVVLIVFSLKNLTYVLKAWQNKARHRLHVPIPVHLVTEYENYINDVECIATSIVYELDSTMYAPEVRQLIEKATPLAQSQQPIETQNGQEPTPLTVEQKNHLTWDEINAREPFTPLLADKGEPTPYPLEALPELARNAVEAIAYHAQAPTALAGQCVLGSLSYIAQKHVNAYDRFSQKGKPCSLYLVTEGASGDRKSTCQKLADQRIYEHEKKKLNDYQNEKDEFKKSLAKSASAIDKAKFLEEFDEPIDPQTMFSDTTLEPIVGRFIEGYMTDATWTSDEAGMLFGGYTMKSDTRESSLGTLTTVWDKGSVQRTRSKSNQNISGSAYDVRLTINTLGQRVVLDKVLNDPVLREQGFLPRFLFSAPKSLAGTRLHTVDSWTKSPYNDERLVKYWQKQTQLLNINTKLQDDGKTPAREVIPLTEEANSLLLNLYNQAESEQGTGGKYTYMRPFASRASELATRISTILAFFEGKEAITSELMQSGITLVNHSLSEWERYGDEIEHDKKLLEASKLENWMIGKCRDQQTTMLERKYIMQNVSISSLRKAKPLDKALTILYQHNHARKVKHERITYIELNPLLFKNKLPKVA